MNIQELKELLLEKGFREEKVDTGFNYTQTVGHVELTCYIEPNIDIAFIAVYKWNDNDVKGTHNVSMYELARSIFSVSSAFKHTTDRMPRYIGLPPEGIDLHAAIINTIDEIF